MILNCGSNLMDIKTDVFSNILLPEYLIDELVLFPHRVFNLSFYAYQSTRLLIKSTQICDVVGLYFTKYF